MSFFRYDIKSTFLRVLAAGLFVLGGIVAPSFHRAEHAREDTHDHQDAAADELPNPYSGTLFLVVESAPPGAVYCVLCAQLLSSEFEFVITPAFLSPEDVEYDSTNRTFESTLSGRRAIRGPPQI